MRWGFLGLTSIMLAAIATPATASVSQALAEFTALYEQELGGTTRCREPQANRYTVCANVLRNEGNAPFIMHHDAPTDKVAVLFHGLSDSPYFMRGIAGSLYEQGFTVIVPLLPGHGLRDADADMQDSQLAERWQQHVDAVMELAGQFGQQQFIGGFSTGAALAVEQYLTEPGDISALMLFSGALALSENAELMWKIWGIKWLARIIDGDYDSHGPNPYKYPTVAGYAGLELMDIIASIRGHLEAGKSIDVPLFVAHSQADATTPIRGVEQLLSHSTQTNTFFQVDEAYDLCHADVPLNSRLVADMHFKTQLVNPRERCAVPKANPLYRQMLFMLRAFVQANTEAGPQQFDGNRPKPFEEFMRDQKAAKAAGQ